jgi:mono/diheme cytochrome c family protein
VRRRRNVCITLAFAACATVYFSGCAREPDAAKQGAAVERGALAYAANCSGCHAQHGQGSVGPELTGERHHKNEQQTVAWIKQALPPMPRLYPHPLSDRDVDDVAAFVMSL